MKEIIYFCMYAYISKYVYVRKVRTCTFLDVQCISYEYYVPIVCKCMYGYVITYFCMIICGRLLQCIGDLQYKYVVCVYVTYVCMYVWRQWFNAISKIKRRPTPVWCAQDATRSGKPCTRCHPRSLSSRWFYMQTSRRLLLTIPYIHTYIHTRYSYCCDGW